MNINGWFASHADTPGPHVRLLANGRNGAVLKTSQIPELIECLYLVAERIDRQWERDGDEYLQDFSDAPDDNYPAVIRERRIAHLVLLENLRTHFAEITEILLRSEDLHDASTAIAPLLGIDEMECLTGSTASIYSP